MVYEVDEENKVIRLQNIEKPIDETQESDSQGVSEQKSSSKGTEKRQVAVPAEWSAEVAEALTPVMSSRVLKELEELVVQGPNYTPAVETTSGDQKLAESSETINAASDKLTHEQKDTNEGKA
jgi:hypothetical protein